MLYENPITHDLELSGGSLRAVEDGSDAAAVIKIVARLLTVVPEWFLDTTVGIDYRNYIWVKDVPTAVRNAHIQYQALLAAGDGSKVIDFIANVDTASRELAVIMNIQLPDGTIVSVNTNLDI